MYNEYEVRPGERLVRMTTTVGHDVGFCPVEDPAELEVIDVAKYRHLGTLQIERLPFLAMLFVLS